MSVLMHKTFIIATIRMACMSLILILIFPVRSQAPLEPVLGYRIDIESILTGIWPRWSKVTLTLLGSTSTPLDKILYSLWEAHYIGHSPRGITFTGSLHFTKGVSITLVLLWHQSLIVCVRWIPMEPNTTHAFQQINQKMIDTLVLHQSDFSKSLMLGQNTLK